MTFWRRPRAVRPGGIIGVCAPAGPVEADALDAGVAELERLGFRVRLTPGVRSRSGFTAGSAATRKADLMGLLLDETIGAVVCARGGAGAIHVLPLLSTGGLPAVPKPVVGYSDITLLHLWLQRAGWMTLHGPMVARDLAQGSSDSESLLAALAGSFRAEHDASSGLSGLRVGRGQGVLRGGCLSLLVAAIGTPWQMIIREPTILFLEDVNEPAYRLDRLLRQLKLAGSLDGVTGVVLGAMAGCAGDPDLPSVADVVAEVLGDLGIPLAVGLRSGHVAEGNLTLPMGCLADLECEGDSAVLTIDGGGPIA